MTKLNYDPRPPERRAAEIADQRAANERYGWLALAGAALVGLGSLLPWVEAHTAFGSVSFDGTEGDGQLTLIGAVIFAAIWLFADLSHNATSGWMLAAVGLAIAGIVIAAVKMSDIRTVIAEVENEYVTASVGIGLWLCLIGAGLALVACFTKVRQ